MKTIETQSEDFYPVRDRVPRADWKALGLEKPPMGLPSVGIYPNNISAVWTGETRCPKKGEWYLSGSIVEAYRAPNNLSTPFQIAKLVKTRTIRVVVKGRAK